MEESAMEGADPFEVFWREQQKASENNNKKDEDTEKKDELSDGDNVDTDEQK